MLMTGLMPVQAADPDCLVIAHRGASAYVPEHTLAAYRLAILLGADYIEPDLVMTRDGELVARHENRLDGTTDVAEREEFVRRRSSREIGGEEVSGWFSEDFSLRELKRLRATERLPEIRPANTALDGLFPIPTMQEIIDLVREMEPVVGRRIGIYPELKTPAYFRERGFDPEGRLVRVLERNGYRGRDAAVFIQSFESQSLMRLRELTDLRLVLLLWRNPDDPRIADAWLNDEGLKILTGFADGIGVEKYSLLIPKDESGRLQPELASDLPARARAAGLLVHAWTFRAENEFLPTNLQSSGPATAPGDSLTEHQMFIEAGVDGVFIEQPEIAAAACRQAPGDKKSRATIRSPGFTD